MKEYDGRRRDVNKIDLIMYLLWPITLIIVISQAVYDGIKSLPDIIYKRFYEKHDKRNLQ